MTNDTKSRRTKALLALLVGGALLLLVPSTTANGENGENGEKKLGELRVLDDRSDRLHDRIVSCEFWIAGLDMPAENGILVIKSHPKRTAVLNDTWETNQAGHFINGPYELEPGRYVVKAFYEYDVRVETVENGDNGHRKVPAAEPREFLVKECPKEPLPCPTDLEAEALGNGDVRLTFTPAEGANATLIYRSVGDQDAQRIAVLSGNATGFVDTETVPGTTYTYEVRHAFDEEESGPCRTVEVTAIPVFPTVVGALAASTVGLLAYAGLRRRV